MTDLLSMSVKKLGTWEERQSTTFTTHHNVLLSVWIIVFEELDDELKNEMCKLFILDSPIGPIAVCLDNITAQVTENAKTKDVVIQENKLSLAYDIRDVNILCLKRIQGRVGV
jgi:hypothetical protein